MNKDIKHLDTFGSANEKRPVESFDTVILRKEQDTEPKVSKFEKAQKIKSKRGIGSYDQEMFKDRENTRGSMVENINITHTDYNTILQRYRKEQEEKKKLERDKCKQDNNNNSKIINDFKVDKFIQRTVPNKEPAKHLVSGITKEVHTVHYDYGKNKKLNTLNLTNVTSLRTAGNMLVGYIDGYPCDIQLLGFNCNFEMCLQISCEKSPSSDGTGRLRYSNGYYLVCFEVKYFDKNEVIYVVINGIRFKCEFKESNKLVKNNFNERIFGLTNILLIQI